MLSLEEINTRSSAVDVIADRTAYDVGPIRYNYRPLSRIAVIIYNYFKLKSAFDPCQLFRRALIDIRCV